MKKKLKQEKKKKKKGRKKREESWAVFEILSSFRILSVNSFLEILTQPVLDKNCQEGTDVISHRACQAHVKFQVNLQYGTVAAFGYIPDAGWSLFSVQLLPQNFLFFHQSNMLHPVSQPLTEKFTGHDTPNKSLAVIKFLIEWLPTTATGRQTEIDERRTEAEVDGLLSMDCPCVSKCEVWTSCWPLTKYSWYQAYTAAGTASRGLLKPAEDGA